ncbi:hypothetical protein J2X57_001454 [Luteibacter sp. 1214]|jgi:hypothetical protein|nr:hypothetical protein [Luteibacter sp. 1214]
MRVLPLAAPGVGVLRVALSRVLGTLELLNVATTLNGQERYQTI